MVYGGADLAIAAFYVTATIVTALVMHRVKPAWSRTRVVLSSSLPVPIVTVGGGVILGLFVYWRSTGISDAAGLALFAIVLVACFIAVSALVLGLVATSIAMLFAR